MKDFDEREIWKMTDNRVPTLIAAGLGIATLVVGAILAGMLLAHWMVR